MSKITCPAIKHRSSGFVLVATLWFIAIIAIAVAYFAERTNQSIESTRVAKGMAEARLTLANTRAEVLFRLAVNGFSTLGLGHGASTISLDDRPYRGSGNDVVRLQDNRGLINLNFSDPVLLGRLLARYGVTGGKMPALIDALADYTDEDELRRLSGAERQEYLMAGLPPPPNELLASPHQLRSVYGWSDLPMLWENERFLLNFSTARISGFMPHTAPREILLGILGAGNEDLINEIIVQRKSQPNLARERIFALMQSSAIDNEYLLGFPSNSIRVTQYSPNLPWAQQINITLTPMSLREPWRVDYYAKIQSKSIGSDDQSIPTLPPPATTLVALPTEG